MGRLCPTFYALLVFIALPAHSLHYLVVLVAFRVLVGKVLVNRALKDTTARRARRLLLFALLDTTARPILRFHCSVLMEAFRTLPDWLPSLIVRPVLLECIARKVKSKITVLPVSSVN